MLLVDNVPAIGMAEGMHSTQSQPQPTMDVSISHSRDPLVRIPPEVCAMFLSLLSAEDLIAASQVSSFPRPHCLDDSLYAPLVKPRSDASLQNTECFSQDISSYTPTEVLELVGELHHVSTTSYFDDIGSILEFFVLSHKVMVRWETANGSLLQHADRLSSLLRYEHSRREARH